jgi:GNAT superfamily N-acetyltransferase
MQLRSAEPEDALAVARVHVRSWQAAYRGLLPDHYLAQLRPKDRAARYDFETRDPLRPHTMVAVEAGVIHGFATTAPARDADLPSHGELYALYVDPDQWGKGVGVALVTAARLRLFELGFAYALLWMLAGNVRGDRFYRKYGWVPDGMRRTDTVWDVTVDEIRYQNVLADCADLPSILRGQGPGSV